MGTNDHYDINPPGTDRFKVENMIVKHTGVVVGQNLLLQVKIHHASRLIAGGIL